MDRNAEPSYDGRRNLSTISVRQLPCRTIGELWTASDTRQRIGQRRQSPGPKGAPIAHDFTPDPDRPHPARYTPAHRRPFWRLIPILVPVDGPSRTPTSIAFSAFRPEPALNSNCSLVRSVRGPISPCSSFDRTPLTAQQQNSISCTPPRQRKRSRMPEDP